MLLQLKLCDAISMCFLEQLFPCYCIRDLIIFLLGVELKA